MAFGATSASQNGWKVTVHPYAVGEPGLRQSLEEVARLMRLAKDDPRIKNWAVDVLYARGIDGRNRPSIRDQAQALLEAFRAQTIYVPDSAGAEHVQAPHITLCLGSECIRGEDCESLCLALGGAMLSIGLPVYMCKVDYGAEHQQHLVLGLIDENGEKFYADPSTHKPLLMSMFGAQDVLWVDPLDQPGTLGAVAPEIVTLGSPHVRRQLFFSGGTWIERRYDRWWENRNGRWSEVRAGLGRPFERSGKWWVSKDGVEVELSDRQVIAMGLGQSVTPVSVTTQTQYQQVTNNQVQAGLRYRIGMQLTFASDPSQMDLATIEQPFQSQWYIESFDVFDQAQAVAGLNQWIQGFIMQGIALQSQTLTNSATVTYQVVGVQSNSATPSTQATPNIPAPTPNGNISLVTATALAALVGGVGFGLWKKGFLRG